MQFEASIDGKQSELFLRPLLKLNSMREIAKSNPGPRTKELSRASRKPFNVRHFYNCPRSSLEEELPQYKYDRLN